MERETDWQETLRQVYYYELERCVIVGIIQPTGVPSIFISIMTKAVTSVTL